MSVRVLLCASVLLLMCGGVLAADAKSKPAAKPAAKEPAKAQPVKTQPAQAAQKSAPEATPKARPRKPAQAAAKSKADQKAKSAKKGPKKLELLAIEKNIVRFTNDRRKQHGLPTLQIDEELIKSARSHAIWMARNRRLQHTSRPVAENIAMGYSSSQGVVHGWMNSSGHRANILNHGYRRIGTAAYETADGTIYWCQQFLR